MLDYIREGDIIVLTELDHLERSSKDLTTIMNEIQQKGATLEVSNLPSMNRIEDENLRRLINNLVIKFYKYQAESERKRIRGWQAQGITFSKQKGIQRGAIKCQENNLRLQLAFKLFFEGATDKEMEEQTGINRRTFKLYRSR
jgi:Resolvase, N terminal domain.